MNWLRKIIAGTAEPRSRTNGFGFPDAPGSIHERSLKAPLGDPLKFRKTYRGK